jgi:hypothetical protein
MRKIVKKIVVGLAGALLFNLSHAQELSLARYVGALEGAVQACVAAFPQQAAVYRNTLRRSVRCDLNDKEFEQWLQQIRSQSPNREQYSQGVEEGRNSMSKNPSDAAKQCGTLNSLVCSPKQ